MRDVKRWIVAGGLLVASLLVLVGVALGASQTVSASIGPVPIPSVPVELCVKADPPGVSKCVSTPPAKSVTLHLSVTAKEQVGVAVVPPTIKRASCPSDQPKGVAAVVSTGSAGATLKVSVTGDGNTGPFKVSLGPISVETPNKSVFVAACTN